MVNVIGVRFQNAGKLYFFDPGPYWPTPGDFVIVETARGIEFGEVVTGVRELNDEKLSAPLKQVVRIASAQDVQHAQDNQRNEKEAYAICQKKIAEHKLDMKLVSVEYTFDNSKILFYFTANGRVDFRSLVKDLASVFKTRIELRQIGVRDEAKMLGGLGPCGRPICCAAFLGDFQPVSIKMAKEQNLSLNPTKISGVCGRLMCCLKYEEDNYEEVRKRMPRVGKEVVTPDGNGVVWDLNIIKETVRVRLQKGDSSELRDYPAADVQRVGMPPAQPAAATVATPPAEAPMAAVPVPAAAAPSADDIPVASDAEDPPASGADMPVLVPAASAPPQQQADTNRRPLRPDEQMRRPGIRAARDSRSREARGDQPGRGARPDSRQGGDPVRGPQMRLAKPVMRENPNRKPGPGPRDNAFAPGRPERRHDRPAEPTADQPRVTDAVPEKTIAPESAAPAPVAQEASAPMREDRPQMPVAPAASAAEAPVKPAPVARTSAASPWKDAVERAMRAAQGGEPAAGREEKPAPVPPKEAIDLEDHQDTHVFPESDSMDDIL